VRQPTQHARRRLNAPVGDPRSGCQGLAAIAFHLPEQAARSAVRRRFPPNGKICDTRASATAA